MSDITRDDLLRLCRCDDPRYGPDHSHPVTDAEALRALLTDECDICGGLGYGDVYQPVTNPIPERMTCGRCGGRGWLPKDGIEVTESYVEGYLGGSGLMLDYMPDEPGKRFYVVPADWLEAEDE